MNLTLLLVQLPNDAIGIWAPAIIIGFSFAAFVAVLFWFLGAFEEMGWGNGPR